MDTDKLEQIERGKRIKNIRENELLMNKTQLAERIGVSAQFLGLVEEGRGNLVYKSIRKLRDLSGHSADYILFGLDDDIINEARDDYLSELAEKIVDDMHNIYDIPSEVEDVLNLWEMEDNEEFLNEDDD